jgi:hypothetical protein
MSDTLGSMNNYYTSHLPLLKARIFFILLARHLLVLWQDLS